MCHDTALGPMTMHAAITECQPHRKAADNMVPYLLRQLHGQIAAVETGSSRVA